MQSQTDSYHIFTYNDSELDLSAKENYALDICIGTNRISFTLFNANRVLGFRYIDTNINILEALDRLNKVKETKPS